MHVHYMPRLRNVAVPLLFALTTLMVAAGKAHAENIDPVGVGDLMPSPDSKVPEGQGTLYETYSNANLWLLDSDYGAFDVIDPMLEGIADMCMALTAVIGKGVVVVVQWLFQLTSIPPLQDAITKSIGGAAEGLTATLLPSALAVGALVAFANHKRGGGSGGLSQLAWVFLSGVVSVSLLTSPGTWVAGVDSARTIGAGVALSATTDGLGDGTQDYPFKLDHEPKFTDNTRDNMVRKASDAVWRSYVATPWCVAEFGSLEVCRKFGPDLLAQGTDKGDRKEWLQQNVTSQAVGDDSVAWRQGHTPTGRIMVTLPALIAITIFGALVILLAFASLTSLLGALMLLLVGVVFACLWVIPGRPRQWGLAWFDQLLARTLEATIATLVLGAVLAVNTATTQMFGVYGWLPSMGLSVAAAVVGVKFRAIVTQIFGVQRNSSGALTGFLAARALNRAFRRGRKAPGHLPRPVNTPDADGGDSDKPSGGGSGPGMPGGPAGGGPNSGSSFLALTRASMRPPAPPPLPAAPPGDLPGLPPAGAARTDVPGPVLTLERAGRGDPGGKAAATIPPSPHKPRAALAPRQEHDPLPGILGGPRGSRRRPTPTLRPEHGTTANYGFRQAPPPADPNTAGPKVIRGTVIRSSPNPPPARRNVWQQPPLPGTAPPRRTDVPGPRNTEG